MKKSFTILCAFFLTALLAGCFDYHETWVYDKEGNASLHIVCALSQDFLEKNSNLSLEEEKLLLTPYWSPENFHHPEVKLLHTQMAVSNAHAVLDILLSGPVAEIAQLPFFKNRTIVFNELPHGFSVQQRIHPGDLTSWPYDGTVKIRHVFPSPIGNGAYPIAGERLLEFKGKLSELSGIRPLVFSAACRYSTPFPWREIIYVALCFFLFFLFALWRKKLRSTRHPKPSPIPGNLHSLPDLLSEAAAIFGQLPAVKVLGARGITEINFVQWEAMANRFSNYLSENALGHGDKVALLLPGGRWRNVMLLGINVAGCVAVPLSPEKTDEEIFQQIQSLNIKAIVIGEKYRERFQKTFLDLKDIKVIWLSVALSRNVMPDFLLKSPSSAPQHYISRDNVAVILPGPQNISLTHGELLAEVFALKAALRPVPGENISTGYNPWDASSLALTVFLPLATGATAVFSDTEGPDALLQTLAAVKVTSLFAPRQIIFALASRTRRLLRNLENFPKKPLARNLKKRAGLSLLRVHSLDYPLPYQYAKLGRQLNINFFSSLAFPETGGPALVSTALHNTIGAQGAPIASVEVILLDKKGKAVNKDSEGELCLQGASVTDSGWPDKLFHTGLVAKRVKCGAYKILGKIK